MMLTKNIDYLTCDPAKFEPLPDSCKSKPKFGDLKLVQMPKVAHHVLKITKAVQTLLKK